MAKGEGEERREVVTSLFGGNIARVGWVGGDCFFGWLGSTPRRYFCISSFLLLVLQSLCIFSAALFIPSTFRSRRI